MFRLFLVVVLAAVAVQAQSVPGEVPEAAEARSALDKLRDIANKASRAGKCAKEFSFVPTTKEVVDKSQTCLAGIKSISDLVQQTEIKKARTRFVTALNKAAEKPHTPKCLKDLVETARQYLRKLNKSAQKNEVAKEDQSKYIKDCVMPVITDIWNNASAAEKKVDECKNKA